MTEETILSMMHSGQFDGIRIDVNTKGNIGRFYIIKDGSMKEFEERFESFFNGNENEKTMNRIERLITNDGEILHILRLYGYKIYESDEIRAFSKEYYNNRNV